MSLTATAPREEASGEASPEIDAGFNGDDFGAVVVAPPLMAAHAAADSIHLVYASQGQRVLAPLQRMLFTAVLTRTTAPPGQHAHE